MLEFEEKPSDIVLVIGGGKPFINWIGNWPQSKNVFCIDRDPSLPYWSDPRFIRGDVLHLVSLCSHDRRLRGMPISTIHADFLLNALPNEVGDKGIRVADIIKNQALLLDEAFPVNVREWFDKIKNGAININEGDLMKVRELTEQRALQQMWEVLAVGGEIVIVDRRHVIDRVISDTAGILQVDQKRVEVTPLEINLSDRMRSSSLRKILLVRHEPISNVGKICLRKLEVPLLVIPQGYYRGDDCY